MKKLMVCLCAAAVMANSGCGRRGASVTVAGSTAFQPFAEKLADQFMQKAAGANITVQGGGSALGIQSVLSGASHIGMADLVELPPEAAALTSFVVARDGICLVVHPDNPVKSLTSDQIRGIYNGTVKKWSEVGGSDAPMVVVSREAGSGTRSSFEKILGKVTLTGDAIIQDSSGTIRETVANDRNAIGYLSHGVINDRIRPVAVDGVESTVEQIVAGRYPLVRPVFFLTKGAPEGDAKRYIEYVLSAEGQALIRANGLIPAK